MAAGMQIVMLAGEAVPYAKVGGLADVLGALPPELEQLGVAVSIILPRYSQIDLAKFGFQPFPVPGETRVPIGFEFIDFDVHVSTLPNSTVKVFLIGNDRFFARDGIYLDQATGKDFPDQADRWIFFQRAALEFINLAFPSVDVIHCHDHQTGLMPAYVRKLARSHPAIAHAALVFTIHNMGYQGLFPASTMSHSGLNIAEFYPGSPFEFFGMLNFMKAGVMFSDAVTTVSETYASEIQQSGEFGYGLEGVLRGLARPPIGILNGIDYDVWNPETDPLIPANYSASRLDGKLASKKALLRAFGLEESRIDPPVLAMISRIDVQKGFDLVVAILDEVMSWDVSFVLLGTANKVTEAELQTIVNRHPGRAGLRFTYSNELSHLTEAGADVFLMPSKYEPCGLNQMYSMRYGTVPVVRATGGLADTVQEFDLDTGKGTGFCFFEYDADSFSEAIQRALSLWTERKLFWRKIMVNGMTTDFSWRRSAKRYIEVYESVVQGRKG